MMTGQRRLLASLQRRSLASRVARAGVPRPGALALLAAAAAFLLMSVLAAPASASERVALVIGNGAYDHVPNLPNPPHDATDVAAAFERLGFQVTRVDNASRSELWDSLQSFSIAASASEIAVVFYAGHGMEVDKRNYLVPTDARLQSDRDVDFQAVPMDLVTQAVERARLLSLIILDACRDNPFVSRMQRGTVTRAVGRGLTRVESSNQTLVAYAAAEGQTADDGKGRNSPYTTALLRYIEEPDLEVDKLFGRVRDAVLAATGGRQQPYTYGSLSGDGVYLTLHVVIENPTVDPPPPVIVEPPEWEEEKVAARAYEAAERLNTIEAYELVRKRFPNTFYATLAQEKIRELKESGPQAAGVDPSPAPQPEDGDAHQVVSLTPPDSGPGVSPKPPPGPTPLDVEAQLGLGPDQKQHIQQALASRGFDPGQADGVFGKRTRDALEQWYSSQGRPQSRYLDEEAARTLLEVYAKLAVDTPDEPEPTVAPVTTITLETVPANARIRVFTQSGSSYHDAMVVEPGPYEVEVKAPDHEEFRQPLFFDGTTKYRISLCRMEPQNQRICEDKSERRTRFVEKRHDKRVAGRASRSFDHVYEGIISPDSWGKNLVKDMVRSICAKTREDVKQRIMTSCKQIGGRGVDRGTFVATLEQCDYKDHRRITHVEGTMVCKGVIGRVQESYDETRQECRNETKLMRVCPKELVTKLR